MKRSLFKQQFTNYYLQILAAIAVTTLMLEMGIMSGWSSPYLARLEASDSPLPLTTQQGSWIESLMSPGKITGSLIGLVSVNKIGSKRTLLIAAFPILFSWLFIMFATNSVLLYIGRLFGGMSLGITICSLSLYVGEVALPQIRGAIISAAVAGGTSVGIVVSSICGSYLSITSSSIIYSVPCVLVIILLFYLPESPHWLVKIKDYEGAKRSIIRYQPTIDPDLELVLLKQLVESSNSQTFCQKVKKLIVFGPLRKSLILIVLLFIFMHLTGMTDIVFHMENIFIRGKVTIIKPSIMVICVNIVSIVTTILSMYLIDKCGRKFLLTLSCAGISMSMFGLGMNFYLINVGFNNSNLQWLTIVSVLSYMAFFFIGMMSVPNTLLGEIFPSDVKSVAASIATFSSAVWSFVCTKSYQPLIDLIGDASVYWIHGTFALLLIPYVQFCILETKGKTLIQIQDELMNRRNEATDIARI